MQKRQSRNPPAKHKHIHLNVEHQRHLLSLHQESMVLRQVLLKINDMPGAKASTEASRTHGVNVPVLTRKMSLAAKSIAQAPLTYTTPRKSGLMTCAIEEPKTNSLREKFKAMVKEYSVQDEPVNTVQVRPTRQEKGSRLSTGEGREEQGKEVETERSPGSDLLGTRAAMSPRTAMKYYVQHLSLYELQEMKQFPEVHFIGPHSQKFPANPDHPQLNYGYDDKEGDYNIVLQDHLAYRYEILEILGQGSFGRVVKCLDHKTGATLAIKIIRNKKRFHEQALTEVKILQQLVEWDPEDKHHNVRMTDYFYFRHHLCIACECLSINLYEFVKSNQYQGFSLSLIKRFTVQLLQSLSLMYKHRLVHCDLKPENILLKHPAKSTIKVIDFGSSCLDSEKVYTYIQSRFYRSPEVILGMTYTMAIDMWSLGCILAELYTGLPIFPGEDEQEQLACVMEVLGVPERYLINIGSRQQLFFDATGKPFIKPNSKGKKRRPGSKTLSHVLRCHDSVFLDFLGKCLLWDPEKRLKPDEALQHEWITQSAKHPSAKHTPPALDLTKVARAILPGEEDPKSPPATTTARIAATDPSHLYYHLTHGFRAENEGTH
ncbi:kinase-like domain-containing protein [Spinellus fusiger]|nr:kinase-like domain-containing protein [Spinellus fusiger]